MKRCVETVLLLLVLLAAAPTVAESSPVAPRLDRAMADGADDAIWSVWVTFADRNLTVEEFPAALAGAEQTLSPRALARRAKVAAPGARLVDALDLPLAADYLTAVAETGARPRRESRWLNAASYEATRVQIAAIARLSFVARIDLVAKFRRTEPAVTPQEVAAATAVRERAEAGAQDRWTLDYGGSTAGLEQINVPPVHEMGLSGAGVVVAVLDAGFRLSHIAVQDVSILAQWDFVHGDGNVQWEPGDHEFQDRHGLQVLSTVMGYRAGELVGPAFGASAILAMTEDTGSETPVEEDNWVAAVEWVESLGADLVTSSLGYYYWYDYSDLDGDTAVTTVAADLAVSRGMAVFTSAGNERENAAFPHITAPADGDSVVAAAAVDLAGDIASFSSPGPTYDGRIKPDLSAQGVENFVASYYNDELYMTANGTSFACPLIAGVATLMLERVPSLTPMQIREALRATADRANNPDNDYGWGIIDAHAAVAYWGPLIEHTPIADTEDLVGPYTVTAHITSRVGLATGTATLFWRVDAGSWNAVPLVVSGPDQFGATIPGQPGGGLVEYYFAATDLDGITIVAPHGAPQSGAYAFAVGTDVTAPELFHPALIDQTPGTWPPRLWAEATDNQALAGVELTFTRNDGALQGPYAFQPASPPAENLFELLFPLAGGEVQVGDVIQYQVTARDAAGIPNTAVSGPHEVRVVASLGRVMVIDDATFGAAAGDRSSVVDIAQWIADAGYLAEIFDPADVDGVSVQGFDVLFLVCGNNQLPLSLPIMRSAIVAFAAAGGKVMVEGGAVAEVALFQPGFPDFGAQVLHGDEYWGDFIGPITALNGLERHPYLVRPHRLPEVIEQDLSQHPYDYGASDLVLPLDAVQVLRSLYVGDVGGVLVYDNDTGPEAAQTVYITLDIGYLDPAVARQMVENGLAHLLSRQAPGEASVAGTVTLHGQTDASGVVVRIGDEFGTITGPDGHYVLTGLHGSTYQVTAEREGFGPATQTVVLATDEQAVGVDFLLLPVTTLTYTADPELPIPDNNAGGVASVITVAESGVVNDLDIDINIAHYAIGQLIVTLTSPSGTMVTLHNRSGATADDIVGNWPATLVVDGPGNLSDFVGEPVQGNWTLAVSDRQFGALGTFHSWGLNLLASPDVLTGAPEAVPAVTRLIGAVPNPFNPQTRVVFELDRRGPVRLDVFDVRGSRVRRLLDEDLPAGRHDVRWDGRDDAGRALASGSYVCRLGAGDAVHQVKMTLVR